MDQVGIGIIEQRAAGSEAQRDREPPTERLDQPPLVVRIPQGMEMRQLPPFSTGPFERWSKRCRWEVGRCGLGQTTSVVSRIARRDLSQTSLS
jgi:hypothetical protein